MLSIVTINFNNASGLTKTLCSLAPFRKAGFEWIFIDGGSQDQSVELSKKFSLPTDVVVSEPDSGIYNAMNKGIQYATGDQILFLNSGDVLHPDIQSIEELDLDKTIDLQLFGFEIRNTVRMPRINAWRIWSMPTSHQAIIYSSSLLRKFPFNEAYRYAADFEHYLRINRAKLKITKAMKPLIINEPYGSDQNLDVVLDEYRRALMNNDYPRLWAHFVYWLKSRYLKVALGL